MNNNRTYHVRSSVGLFLAAFGVLQAHLTLMRGSDVHTPSG